MRRFFILISLVLLALAGPRRAWCQDADTSDLFLNAYMANEDGEHLESAGSPRAALAKYQYAANLLDQITHDDPKWQPIVVDYRKKKVGENIARLEQQLGPEPAPPSETPGAPLEGPLPSNDILPGGPDLSGGAQPPAPPPPSEPAPPPPSEPAIPSGLSGDVRAQLEELENDLRASQARLKSVENDKEDLANKLNDALNQLDSTKVSDAELKGQLKQAQDAYQNALADHSQAASGPKALLARIAQLEEALKNTAADRDAAAELNDDEARRAAKTRESAEAGEAALKTQLKAAQDALAAHSQTPGAEKQAQTRIAQLEEALKNAEADRDAAAAMNEDDARRAARTRAASAALAQQLDAAHAQNKELEGKLSDATRLAPQLDAAKKQIAALTKDRDDAAHRAEDLESQLTSTSKTAAKLADAEKQIAALKAGQAQTAAQTSDISAKLADARKQIGQLTQDRDTARQQAAALDAKLASAQKEIVSVKADRDQIAAQRDQALADLTKAREAEKHVTQLLADNATLSQKLAADEKTIRDFKSNSPEKDKEIASLRKEVSDTKALLTAAQQDRDNVQSTLSDLQQQYDATSAELTELKANSALGATEKKTLTDENGLLRGIVYRELKQQAKRDQAKRLVMSELSQMQVQSDTLLNNINYLGQPVVQLTDKEKALFKDPSIDIPDTDESSMNIMITAPKQPAPAAAAPSQAPASADVPAAPQTPAPDTAGAAPESAPAPAAPSGLPSATPMQMASIANPGGSDNAVPPSAPRPPAEPSAPAAEKPDTGTASSPAPGTGGGAAPMVPPGLIDDAHAAKDAFDRTHYRDAERIYERMLTTAPNNVYILSNLGVVYFRDDKSNLAEEMLKKAIAVAPEDVFSHCTLGIVYYQEKQYDDAITELTRALAIDNKYPVAHNYLGITASQKGWSDAAKKELETAIEYDPHYADAYFNLAVVYATEQPPDKGLAGKYYKQAIELGAEPDAALEQMVK